MFGVIGQDRPGHASVPWIAVHGMRFDLPQVLVTWIEFQVELGLV